MAHKNIDERREWLGRSVNHLKLLTPALAEEACALFGCTVGAIRMDWQILQINSLGRDVTGSSRRTTITPAVKRIVKARDGSICQYCEQDAGDLFVLEHVVPTAWGGVADPKNIVIACRSCNALKGRGVWIPHNFYEITANDLTWRQLAINLQRRGKEHNGCRKITRPKKIGA